MKKSNPFLLLMPSYNQAHFICEAVESVLAQDDPDWELWILDNSTDETPKVMAAYLDPRIHFIHEPRRMGPGTCLNELLGLAVGEHFSYVHTDNNLLPGYVRHFRKALSLHPLALAYCDYFEIEGGSRRSRPRRRPDPFPLPRLFSADSLGVPFAATVALAKKAGGFSSDDLADDCFFVMRADGLGPRFHVKEPIVDYRVHDNSRTELSGVQDVARSIYRSALKAYSLRAPELPDPYLGMEHRIHRHVKAASDFAIVLAGHLLSRVSPEAGLWIEGTGPASFWLAWGCAELGRPPLGFRDKMDATLLGLPVKAMETPMEKGGCCLRPRSKGPHPASLGPSWYLPLYMAITGHSPLDHVIKRYPAPVMASLLAPLQVQSPGSTPVWVFGNDALAAYLGYGLETLAGLPLGGWISPQSMALGGLPVSPSCAGKPRVWVPPGNACVPDGAVQWHARG